MSSLSHEGVPNSEHSVCRCEPVQTFRGGSSQKLLTRSRLIVPSGDTKKMLVCAADEISMNVSCIIHVFVLVCVLPGAVFFYTITSEQIFRFLPFFGSIDGPDL